MSTCVTSGRVDDVFGTSNNDHLFYFLSSPFTSLFVTLYLSCLTFSLSRRPFLQMLFSGNTFLLHIYIYFFLWSKFNVFSSDLVLVSLFLSRLPSYSYFFISHFLNISSFFFNLFNVILSSNHMFCHCSFFSLYLKPLTTLNSISYHFFLSHDSISYHFFPITHLVSFLSHSRCICHYILSLSCGLLIPS